ncbi:glutaredoxin family protein [Undibacterium flavidum]|uniref:Glutaredoxin family protein n=1 Tax=Undibacterium flavidum TaxID=2762297 RepID=A0ABR6YHN6_9BURK|nr:glutaredoxin family protein [Undibacterium flavidum]MBC3876096.1 glutaredoxin family protein [Undibacterium flavidum]
MFAAPNYIRQLGFACVLIVGGTGALVLSPAASAQMYKWVGANGKIVYSDTPPPANAKKLGTKALDKSANISNVRLPFELAAAVAKNPVTLYTAKNCSVCNEARNLLKQNGIPFFEKTIESKEDVDKLKQVSGDTNIPLLQISGTKLSGFQAIDWRTALTSAGYPETNMLPKEYQYPEPAPAAPPVADASKPADNTPKEVARPKSTSPTGIRF